MTTLDWATLIVAILLAVVGLFAGFGRTLRFFTKGIFGIIISVFVCATFGGMIAGIPAVNGWIASLNEKLGQAWSFFGTIRLATVLYYVVLFFVVQLLRILLVKFVAGVFEADVLAVRVINKVLGALLCVAAVLLLVLLVFAVIGAFDGTSFVQGFEDALNGSFLGRLYESNPVKFS